MSKTRRPTGSEGDGLTFEGLVRSIRGVDAELAAQAGRAVNVSLTLRNCFIVCYIAEYELRGQDLATYGEKLLDSLAAELSRLAVSNSNRRQLYRYLRFYRTYPGIVGTLSPQSGLSPETLLNRLSYSHLELIVDLDDEAKRDFYAAECTRGNWSVRGLKRQIASLDFERSGLSCDNAKLAQAGADPAGSRWQTAIPKNESSRRPPLAPTTTWDESACSTITPGR